MLFYHMAAIIDDNCNQVSVLISWDTALDVCMSTNQEKISLTTVDGRNPVPPGMYETL